MSKTNEAKEVESEEQKMKDEIEALRRQLSQYQARERHIEWKRSASI